MGNGNAVIILFSCNNFKLTEKIPSYASKKKYYFFMGNVMYTCHVFGLNPVIERQFVEDKTR